MSEPPPPEDLRTRFTRLALPSIAASLLVPIQGLVDTALLGHLDALEPLAGVALAGVIFDLLYWSFGFLRMGTTGLAAQAVGREDRGEVRALLLRAGLVALLLGLLVVAAQALVARTAFAILDGEPAVELAGRRYFDARIWGAPAVLLNFCAIGWLLALSRTRAILAIALVANGGNMILDYLLIIELGWGAAGAGWATMLSQLLALGIAAPLVRSAWRSLDDGGPTAPVVSLAAIAPILRLGRDIWIRTFALVSAFAIFTNFSAVFSSTILAANAILLRLLGLVSYFVDGFALATETMVGAFAGADHRRGMRATLAMSLRWGLATALAFGLTFAAFPGLFSLLTNQPELLAAVVDGRGWLVVVLVLGSIAYILDGYFIGLAAGTTLARAMLLSFGLGFLPLALWARYGGGGPDALWAAMLVFMAARGLTLAAGVPGTLRPPSSGAGAT